MTNLTCKTRAYLELEHAHRFGKLMREALQAHFPNIAISYDFWVDLNTPRTDKHVAGVILRSKSFKFKFPVWWLFEYKYGPYYIPVRVLLERSGAFNTR